VAALDAAASRSRSPRARLTRLASACSRRAVSTVRIQVVDVARSMNFIRDRQELGLGRLPAALPGGNLSLDALEITPMRHQPQRLIDVAELALNRVKLAHNRAKSLEEAAAKPPDDVDHAAHRCQRCQDL
jgi:hypothetical protein